MSGFLGGDRRGIFEYMGRDEIEYFYEDVATYTPFDNPKDTRTDRAGARLRDKEYLIGNTTDEIVIFAPIEEGRTYAKVGYVQFTKEKTSPKRKEAYMKLWYLSVVPDYEGLGLGSMLIAGVKHRCMVERIDTLVLDSARRFKEKKADTEEKYPQLKNDGHSYYDANRALYESHDFVIDRESPSYEPSMETNRFYFGGPIPMKCHISNILSPASVQTFGQEQKANSSPKYTQDQGLCQ